MKKVMLGLVALALSLPVMSRAQSSTSESDQAKQNDQSRQSDQATQSQGKGNQKLSGTVSKDDKTFTNDADSKTYQVDNPDALKGQEGQHVGLIVHVDPDNNVIHIIQVAPPQ